MASLRDLEPPVTRLAQQFVRVLEHPLFAQAVGVPQVRVIVTSTRRSMAKQAQLYEAYISGRSRYPAAPPGSSPHALGIAFDIAIEPKSVQLAALRLAGALWEAIGYRWGGRFNDPIHFDTRPRNYVSTRPLSAAEVRARARLPRH